MNCNEMHPTFWNSLTLIDHNFGTKSPIELKQTKQNKTKQNKTKQKKKNKTKQNKTKQTNKNKQTNKQTKQQQQQQKHSKVKISQFLIMLISHLR